MLGNVSFVADSIPRVLGVLHNKKANSPKVLKDWAINAYLIITLINFTNFYILANIVFVAESSL